MSERIPAGGPYRALSGAHEPLTSELLREARNMLSSYCQGDRRFCSKYVERVLEVSHRVAFKRLVDLYGEEYRGVDRGIVKVFEDLIDFYSRYIAGVYALHGEEVLVKFKAEAVIGGRRVSPGEVAVLQPGEAARLYIGGFAEPVASNSVALRLKGSKDVDL